MNRRDSLVVEVSIFLSMIVFGPIVIPSVFFVSWRKDIVSLEFELNNLVDSEEDNNY